MSRKLSVLLLQGDAEASFLADADVTLQAIFPEHDVTVTRAWVSRPDWISKTGTFGAKTDPSQVDAEDVGGEEVLQRTYQFVVLALLPAVVLPGYMQSSGKVLLAHRGLLESMGAASAVAMPTHSENVAPMSVADCIAAVEPLVCQLLESGVAVAVSNSFRHVDRLPPQWVASAASLRECIRHLNLEIARLSQRTGCFVLDLDRPLAQVGAKLLQADCFGGNERAAELALDEFAALAMDALPDEFMPLETP